MQYYRKRREGFEAYRQSNPRIQKANKRRSIIKESTAWD